MRYVTCIVTAALFIFLTTTAQGGDAAIELSTASGAVEKADKDSLTIQPRGVGGKFAKKMVLKITGTSKLSAVTMEKRAGKLVPVQRDVEPKDLEANQHIAVIYLGGAEPVLLSAVAHRAK